MNISFTARTKTWSPPPTVRGRRKLKRFVSASWFEQRGHELTSQNGQMGFVAVSGLIKIGCWAERVFCPVVVPPVGAGMAATLSVFPRPWVRPAIRGPMMISNAIGTGAAPWAAGRLCQESRLESASLKHIICGDWTSVVVQLTGARWVSNGTKPQSRSRIPKSLKTDYVLAAHPWDFSRTKLVMLETEPVGMSTVF